jgi:Zn-dependent peptidase ImmA (M78 family)
MAWDEFSVVLKAREFIRSSNVAAIPVPLEPYLMAARANVREMADMAADEAGTCFPMADGSHRICVNANDRVERRRFTVCHEIGHIVLGLRSDHKTQAWSMGRPLAERLCDLFAAQLLLPDHLFESAAEEAQMSLAAIDALADRFVASVTATGSRFAESISTPCAFVLSQRGKVIHASRSKALKDARAIIPPQTDLPSGSVSARTRAGELLGRQEIDAADWFSNWESGGVLLEESRHLAQWDQTLTLIWFESLNVPSGQDASRERRWEVEGRDMPYRREEEDEFGLKELDGNLRWPGRSRRR